MSDPSKPTGDLFNELFALGNNVTRLMRTAWDSPERKKAQGELETALNDMAATLNRAGLEFLDLRDRAARGAAQGLGTPARRARSEAIELKRNSRLSYFSTTSRSAPWPRACRRSIRRSRSG